MKREFIKKIGKELKIIRIENNYKQDEVAKKTGIASSIISSYETGNKDIRINKLIQLLDFYNVKPEIFFQRIYAKTQENE